MHSSPTTAGTPRATASLKKPAAALAVHTILLLALLAALAGSVTLRAESALQYEYDIKATYLCKFFNYIDWPADSLPPVGGTIIIGIMGENPFGPAVDWLNGKQIKGRTIAVKQITTVKDLEQCQILFISTSEKARLPEIFGQLKDSRVLTVSEMDGFASQGGIINFISERNKVRLEINPEAARRMGLTISSELLKLAKLVKS